MSRRDARDEDDVGLGVTVKRATGTAGAVREKMPRRRDTEAAGRVRYDSTLVRGYRCY